MPRAPAIDVRLLKFSSRSDMTNFCKGCFFSGKRPIGTTLLAGFWTARNRAGNLGADIVRLRSVEWYVCEKCLASEYSLHLCKSFEGCLHNIISGPCLPKRNNIELSWYRPSFDDPG